MNITAISSMRNRPVIPHDWHWARLLAEATQPARLYFIVFACWLALTMPNETQAQISRDTFVYSGGSKKGTKLANVTYQTALLTNANPSYALATMLKTRTAYDNNSTPTDITDDIVTYGLSLRIESSDVTGTNITPLALVGTMLFIDGNPANRILISDAIPPGTKLNAIPIAPPGWQVIYTTSNASTNSANQASWLTTAPALSTVSRIGFINNPNLITSIAPGTTITGFNVQIRVAVGQPAPLIVANTAQAFGQSAGDLTNLLIFDGSGDQIPNNFKETADNLTLPKTVDMGYFDNPASLTSDDIDLNNNNSNSNANGQGKANVYTIRLPATLTITAGTNPAAVTACLGTVSSNQTFTVAGSNLTDNIVVSASADFEVSTSANSGFSSSLTVTQSGGSVAGTTLFVRTAATATVGPKSGTITLASTGAPSQTLAVSGTVTALPLVSIAASSTSAVLPNSPVQLIASGTASTYLWEDNSTTTPRTVNPVTTTIYSTTGTSGSCSNTASITVQVTLPTPPIVLLVTSPALVQSLILSTTNCPITFTGQGWGKSFVITNSKGYVFSNVFRDFIQGGIISASGIKQLGSYTITVYGDPSQTPVSYQFQVTGTGCN